jgi:hypothetical protein
MSKHEAIKKWLWTELQRPLVASGHGTVFKITFLAHFVRFLGERNCLSQTGSIETLRFERTRTAALALSAWRCRPGVVGAPNR